MLRPQLLVRPTEPDVSVMSGAPLGVSPGVVLLPGDPAVLTPALTHSGAPRGVRPRPKGVRPREATPRGRAEAEGVRPVACVAGGGAC